MSHLRNARVEELRRTNSKKKGHLQKSEMKIMLIIFYDSDGIYKEFVLQDKTVNGDYYETFADKN